MILRRPERRGAGPFPRIALRGRHFDAVVRVRPIGRSVRRLQDVERGADFRGGIRVDGHRTAGEAVGERTRRGNPRVVRPQQLKVGVVVVQNPVIDVACADGHVRNQLALHPRGVFGGRVLFQIRIDHRVDPAGGAERRERRQRREELRRDVAAGVVERVVPVLRDQARAGPRIGLRRLAVRIERVRVQVSHRVAEDAERGFGDRLAVARQVPRGADSGHRVDPGEHVLPRIGARREDRAELPRLFRLLGIEIAIPLPSHAGVHRHAPQRVGVGHINRLAEQRVRRRREWKVVDDDLRRRAAAESELIVAGRFVLEHSRAGVFPVVGRADLELVRPAEVRLRRNVRDGRFELVAVLRPVLHRFVRSVHKVVAQLDAARIPLHVGAVRKSVLTDLCGGLRDVMGVIAAVAVDHVEEQVVARSALHFSFPRLIGLALERRRRQRSQLAGSAHGRMMFDRAELRGDQLRGGPHLIIDLPIELRQRLRRRAGRRAAAAGEPAAVGVRRRNEPDLPLRHGLLTRAAVEPQLVPHDAAAEIEVVVVEAGIDDRIRIGNALRGELGGHVVALPFRILVRTARAAVERVAARLHHRDLRHAGEGDLRVVAAGLELRFLERERIQVNGRVGVVSGDRVDPLDVERRLEHDAVGDDRRARCEVAVADVRFGLHAETSGERQHLLHRPAHWNAAQLLLHEGRLARDVHGVDDRTQAGHLHRFRQRTDLHHGVDSARGAGRQMHVGADRRLKARQLERDGVYARRKFEDAIVALGARDRAQLRHLERGTLQRDRDARHRGTGLVGHSADEACGLRRLSCGEAGREADDHDAQSRDDRRRANTRHMRPPD